MQQIYLCLSLFLVVSCATSSTQLETLSATSTVKCKSGKDERLLEINSTEAGGCELSYRKFGERKIIATSIQGMSHCEKVMKKTTSLLENAKFVCS